MMTTNASECEIIANLRAMFFCYSTSFITSSASSLALPRFYFSSMPRLYHSLLIDHSSSTKAGAVPWHGINCIRLTRSPSSQKATLCLAWPGHDQWHITIVMNIIIAPQLPQQREALANAQITTPSVVEVSALHLEFHHPSLCPSWLGGNCYLTPAGKRILLSLNRNKISI